MNTELPDISGDSGGSNGFLSVYLLFRDFHDHKDTIYRYLAMSGVANPRQWVVVKNDKRKRLIDYIRRSMRELGEEGVDYRWGERGKGKMFWNLTRPHIIVRAIKEGYARWRSDV